jgi:beta-phosphoglucomutase
LWGQDMAGLDVVLWQLVPGFDQGPFTNIAGDADGEFFHYGLAKMGSSLGHLDPKKKGRTLCEVFGAYGWREGLKLMKWITDHMLVRGVNYFVPHAFSQAEFPDPDCPPHMDARGFNPQFRYYQLLNQSTNRISHLLSGGVHVASVAVLYHAEAEWSGVAMAFQKPVAALMRHQVDCDVLPGDILLNSAWVIDGKLKVGEETYHGLVLPFGAALPTALLARLEYLAEHGLPLFFVDGLPLRSSEGSDVSDVINRPAAHAMVQTLSIGELAGRIIELGFHECKTENDQPYLRNFHIRHPGLDVFMFFNEHPYQAVNTKINLAITGVVMTYDALSNTVSRLEFVQHSQGIIFPLFLHPYETTFVIAGESLQNLIASPAGGLHWSPDQTTREQAFEGPWSISTATAKQFPDFESWGTVNKLANMSESRSLPDFSGTFRYQTKFKWTDAITPVWLDLGEAYETTEVWVNDRPAGIRLCPPYQMEISGLLQPGVNKLTVDVTNTLVKSTPDFFSRFAHQEPSGLLGPVRLLFSQPVRYQAAIFDLDGVIVDTAKYHYLAWKELAHELGFEFTEVDNERLKGVSRMRSLEILLEVGGLNLDMATRLQLAEKKNRRYVELISQLEQSDLLPGARDCLMRLRAKGVKTILGTASKNAPLILSHLKIADLFDAIVDGNKTSKAKPDPEVFLLGARELHIDPPYCVVFEDAEAGIQAAKAAGMGVVGIGRPEVLAADLVVDGLQNFDIDSLF